MCQPCSHLVSPAFLNEAGFNFVRRCINLVEVRGEVFVIMHIITFCWFLCRYWKSLFLYASIFAFTAVFNMYYTFLMTVKGSIQWGSTELEVSTPKYRSWWLQHFVSTFCLRRHVYSPALSFMSYSFRFILHILHYAYYSDTQIHILSKCVNVLCC